MGLVGEANLFGNAGAGAGLQHMTVLSALQGGVRMGFPNCG